MTARTVDPAILEYASTDQQRRIIQAVIDAGSVRGAAAAIKLSRQYIERTVQTVEARATRQGVAPSHDLTHPIPDGYKLRGTSTLYKADGSLALQWVKTKEDTERQLAAIIEAAQSIAETIPRAVQTPAPQQTQDALCNLYTITDYHLGMLAWHPETGADWDLSIARDTLARCYQYLLTALPPAKQAIICQLGDFLHADGLIPQTPTSQHVLDADSRFPKVVGVAVQLLRSMIDGALERHEQVHVILAEGNHDQASSVWLRTIFATLYDREPRVTIEQSPLPYYAHKHGQCMLAFHHGHLRKPTQLPSLFAAQFPKIWGGTTYRYGHSGHLHHERVIEAHGMTWTQHPTLAARDAYAARGGWHSARQALAIAYHAEHGQVSQVSVRPEMMQSA